MKQSKSNTRRKPRLRVLPPPRPAGEIPRTITVEFPPGIPKAEERNLVSIRAADSNNEPTMRQGDVCVVWLGHPFKSGEFGAVQINEETFYLGRLRHHPGGYVTLEEERGGQGEGTSRTFKPGAYQRTGRAFSIERNGKVIQRF